MRFLTWKPSYNMPMAVSWRRTCAALALLISGPGIVRALEAVPPFEFFAPGPVTPELHARVSADSRLGLGYSFCGADPERQLQAENYSVTQLLLGYGIWKNLEIYGAFPFYYGRSPQRCLVYVMGYPVDLAGTVSGYDFGDAAFGLRFQFLGNEEEPRAAVVSVGFVPPMGTNVWQGIRYSFQGMLEVPESLAVGDGAWKALAGLNYIHKTERFEIEGMAGYLLKFPLEVTGMGIGYGSTVTVRQPSPLLVSLRPEYEIWPGLWLAADIEGYWAPRGKITAGGFLADEPDSLEKVLGSYVNLAAASGALWAGAGIRWQPDERYRLRFGVNAPAAVHRTYRSWRASLALSYVWFPK